MGTSTGPSTRAGADNNAIARTTKPQAPKGQEPTFPNPKPSRGIRREEAARFSFLMSVTVTAAAAGLSLTEAV